MTPATVEAPAAGSLQFTLPADREAREPAEVRGRGRDDVRLMVARRSDGTIAHHRFADIADVLAPGDLLVVNTSATVAAALPARRSDGTLLRLHLSTRLPGGRWLVELRRPEGTGSLPFGDGRPGEVLTLPSSGLPPATPGAAGSGERASARLLGPWRPGSHRLWVADVVFDGPPDAYLRAHGSPVRYRHVRDPWPLSAYRTVYATEEGSAEMPSAGRAFTPEIVTRLVAAGVGVAPVVLHSGVSSPEAHEPPIPEWFRVPAATARWVNATRGDGSAVVAVGTTVVRALETVTDGRGAAHPGEGWTELVVGPERGVRVIDGLLTGWHEPEASHLRLLEAVAGRELLLRSYREALAHRYLWHEFGDLHLVLP